MKRLFLALFMLGTIDFTPSSVTASGSQNPAAILTELAPNVMLRDSALVDAKVIYLGDLFSDTGDKLTSP